MNLDELERLADMVQSANIYELTLKQGDNRLTFRKPPTAPNDPPANGGELVRYDSAQPDDSAESDDGTIDGELVAISDPEPIMVEAPLVGVFHHTKPMTGLGAKVKEGQIIGTIKIVNITDSVFAPINGRIVEVLVEDGMPVEYGHELFAIEPESA